MGVEKALAPSVNGRANGWKDLAVWALIVLLTGAWVWLRTDLSALETRQERAVVMQLKDHDDVVRLREVVPRIEAELHVIKRQNEEILRELRGR